MHNTPTPDQVDVLMTIAAKIDALHTPMRPTSRGVGEFAGGWMCAVQESRQLFRRSGVPYSTAGSILERQAAGRMLASLDQLGLAIVYSTTGRRVGVRLTDRGDLWVRGLTGDYTPWESWPLLQQIAALTDAACTNAGCVCEVRILHSEYDKVKSPELVGLEHRCIPFIVRDFLSSACDIEGRVGYALTDSGRGALSRKKPRRPRWLPMPNDAAYEKFAELYKRAMADRQTWKSERSHVLIPLGAGSWPEVEASP